MLQYVQQKTKNGGKKYVVSRVDISNIGNIENFKAINHKAETKMPMDQRVVINGQ